MLALERNASRAINARIVTSTLKLIAIKKFRLMAALSLMVHSVMEVMLSKYIIL